MGIEPNTLCTVVLGASLTAWIPSIASNRRESCYECQTLAGGPEIFVHDT